MKTDDVLKLILGYRDAGILFHLNKLSLTKKAEFLEREWPTLYKQFMSMPHYLSYQAFNYALYGRLEEERPIIKGHQDIPLGDYILGLNERNRLIWKDINMEYVLQFAKGKRVLDFGYGGGFYTDYLCKMCPTVYGIERDDVSTFVKDNIMLPPNFVFLRQDEPIPEVDVIWVSEVFHGKPEEEIKAAVGDLRRCLVAGGKLYINELIPNTILSKHFPTQMSLHTTQGKLYSKFDYVRLIGWKPGISYEEYKYHFIQGGEL